MMKRARKAEKTGKCTTGRWNSKLPPQLFPLLVFYLPVVHFPVFKREVE
jgi:hypothetical protein